MKKVTKKELRKTALKLLPAIYDSAMRTGAEDGLFQHEDWRTGLCLDAFLLAEAFEKTANYRDAEPEPQLKKLDQSVFDGLDEKWRFAAVDDDGRAYGFMKKPVIDQDDPCFIDEDTTRCKWIGEGYDASNWQNSLIERDIAKELTGSELCKAMLARGDKCVLIRMGVRDDKQAKELGRFAIATSIDESGRFNVMSDQQPISKVDFAVPINNQGEPLTAAEAGL